MDDTAPHDDAFRRLIEAGDVEGVRAALAAEPALAHRPIHWFLNQPNASDPLHYVSDCVGQGWLVNGREGELAEVLIAHGAAIDGANGRESPLIGAASLGAEKVATVLVDAGAALERTSVFGARALHWAAWLGLPATVDRLIARGADIEARCAEFGATPLVWAVHGYGPHGAARKDQIGAASRLVAAGARLDATNKHGETALAMARDYDDRAMYAMLEPHAA